MRIGLDGTDIVATGDVLLVEDEPLVVELFSAAISAGGYRVWTAMTGHMALTLAKEHHPDIVLMDVGLPDLSGLEVCRQIKADPDLGGVIVVVVSGQAMRAAEVVNGFGVGADDYLKKPVELSELLARIRTWVRFGRASKALRASEQHYRQLVEALPDAVVLLNLEGRFMSVNPQAASFFGALDVEGAVGKSFFDFTLPAEHRRIQADFAGLLRTGSLKHTDYTIVTSGGRSVSAQVTGALWGVVEGRPNGFLLVVRDISEVRRLERAVQEVSERDLRWFGEMLHDGLCQRMFAAAVTCNLLREKLARRGLPEAEEAGELLARLNGAMDDARSQARGLMLSNLAHDGLAASLKELASMTCRDFRVLCEAECADSLSVGDNWVATHLYRLAREAVHNATKHARPRRIVVRLSIDEGRGCLEIEDDGIGMADGNGWKPGLGLTMMLSRARMIGGELVIGRSPSGGTRITCGFPVDSRRPWADQRQGCGFEVERKEATGYEGSRQKSNAEADTIGG